MRSNGTMSDFLPTTACVNGGDTQALAHRSVLLGVVDAIIARGEKPTAYSTYDRDSMSSCLKHS